MIWQLPDIQQLFSTIDPYVNYILPIIAWIIQTIGPTMFGLGAWLKNAVGALVSILPVGSLIPYFIVAGVLFVIGIIVNAKWSKAPGEDD